MSRTFAGERQVPENDQANQTTEQHKNQKPHQKQTQTKKPQQNKPKQQNQPFTLVRRRAQVARPGLEQSKKNSLGCTGMHCVSEECIRFKCRQDEACIGIIGIQEGRQADIAACHTPSHREDPVVSQLQDQNSRPGTIRANLFRSPVQYLEAMGTFPHAYLNYHPCPSLCFVLEEPTVSGAAPLPGSFEMQGKRDLCQLRPLVFAIPGLSNIRAGHRIYVVGYVG